MDFRSGFPHSFAVIAPTPENRGAPEPFRLGSFWVFLILGLILRTVALQQPLMDAMMYRQAQTASVTQGLAEQPGWPIAANVHWLGDKQAKILLELPLYNYLVLGVNKIAGNLDISGKLTSVLLWGLSFFLLQGIWAKLLSKEHIFWANLLFVLSPLEVFYGQAFMPEMLIQALSFGFVGALLSYAEQPGTLRFLTWALLGLLGMLIKVPEFLHLYVFSALVFFARDRWKTLSNWRYWAAILITALAVKLWGNITSEINASAIPEWTPAAILPGFIGSLGMRLDPWRIFKLLQYPPILIFTIPGTLLVLLGAGVLWKARPFRDFASRMTVFWIFALIFFYLFWAGTVAWTQAYYNLPAVPVFCVLFALGMVALLRWGQKKSALWLQPRVMGPAVSLLLLPFLVGGNLFQFNQDQRVLYEAAIWLRDHTPQTDLALVVANHHPNLIRYRHLSIVSYYSERRIWAITPDFAGQEREHALATAKWAIVTHPAQLTSSVERLRRAFRKTGFPAQDISWLETAGFHKLGEGNSFSIYVKTPLSVSPAGGAGE